MNNMVKIETRDTLPPCVNIYLSAPYRGEADVVAERMRYIASIVQSLRADGHFVTSALLHHWTIPSVDPTETSNYWLEYSAMLVRALASTATADVPVELWVICAPGWNESSGVRVEREEAIKCGIKIRYIDPLWYDLLREVSLESLTDNVK